MLGVGAGQGGAIAGDFVGDPAAARHRLVRTTDHVGTVALELSGERRLDRGLAYSKSCGASLRWTTEGSRPQEVCTVIRRCL